MPTFKIRKAHRTLLPRRDEIDWRGDLEIELRYASGRKKGDLYHSEIGKNVVTNWLSPGGAAPTSGRDLMRRLLVPPGFSGSLAGASGAWAGRMELGSGTNAAIAADTGLQTPIPGTQKDIASVTFDPSNPYVSFEVQYAENEANVTISEAILLSSLSTDGTVRGDVLSRKVFASFPKTVDFLLGLRWTYKF